MDKMMKTEIRKKPNQLNISPASIHIDRNLSANGVVDNRSVTALQRKLMAGIDHSPQATAQRQAQAQLNDGPVMSLQRRQFETAFGRPIQRLEAMEEEELLQGRFETVQRQGALEEEELLQGKFGTVQRVEEEEELLQGKFEIAQRQEDLEEEGLLQGKFDLVQRQSLEEEEEALQGKFYTGTNSFQLQQEYTQQDNRTGMPDQLKAGVESLSGVDLSDVQVHRNSNKPARLNALAYAQGSDIHLGPGQDQHLPHEAWHVAQQRQGRVKPTMQMAGEQINNDVGLEKEADVMGEKALQHKKG